ncbi:MAG TPA: class I SAM-dependent methyltransferase [Burkholderiales bacterium]|nr:class I SAM-dependent methyltransferase [Burkholderiales bacterium]
MNEHSQKPMSRAWLLGGLLLLAAASGQPALSQMRVAAAAPAITGADPAINSRFYKADAGVWAERFEGESREIYRQRSGIVTASGISTGMTVADVGAGTGLFTMLFARQVGAGGRVVAVDISPSFLESIAKRAKIEGFSNIGTLLGAHNDIRLPEGAVDIVFTSDTYHHFEQVVPILASIHRALKPGGRFVVIDFERIPGVSPPSRLEHVRAGKETVMEEVNAAGFRLRQEITGVGLTDNYYLIFEKR